MLFRSSIFVTSTCLLLPLLLDRPCCRVLGQTQPVRDNNDDQGQQHVYDVLIIGGGFAGLGAAQQLIDDDVTTNFAILEGRDRLGGRSYTNYDGLGPGLVTEIGSAWLYPGTKLLKLAEDLDINFALSEILWENFGLYDSNGILSEAARQTLLEDEWRNKFVPFAYKEAKEGVDVDQIKQDFYDEENLVQLSTSEANDIGDYSEKRQSINAMINAGIVVEFGSELEDTESVSVIEYVTRGSWRDIEFMGVPGGGYSKIIDAISEPLSDHIILNTKVTEIGWDSNYLIGVSSVNPQTGEQRSYVARTLVVTAPLGVLKHGDITFNPPLPEEKREAINNVGFGTLNKAVMYWDQNVQDVSWFPTEVDGQLITDYDVGSEEWTYFFNDHSQDGNENNYVLTSWIGGTAADLWDDKPDSETVAYIMNNLREMFGPTVPDPTNTIITHWKGDEYSRGSYSFDLVGIDASSARSALGETIGGRIYFAGEATDTVWWGTAVGAHETGLSVADEIRKSKILEDINVLPLPPLPDGGDSNLPFDPLCFGAEANNMPCDTDEDCCPTHECKVSMIDPDTDYMMHVCKRKPSCNGGRQRIGGTTRGGQAARSRASGCGV